LKEDGQFLNEKVDKKVWLMWMEGRVHGEYDAIETPIGFIPKYEDLKVLFKKIFDRDFTMEEYNKEFSIRVSKFLEKMDRMEELYKDEDNMPEEFYSTLSKIRERLNVAKEKYGKEIIPPQEFI